MATNNLYTTKTAALKATKADINNLSVKKLFLGGENILDIINRATPTIKHSQDTRETVTENDLWGQWVETKADGTIVVHDDAVTNPNANQQQVWNSSIIKVEDNKAYTGEIDFYGNLSNLALFANVQTEKIKDGHHMFSNCNFPFFDADLSSLINGKEMFSNCNRLDTFYSNLSSLINGYYMFANCNSLATFSSDLSSLTNGEEMFSNCTRLTSFSSNLSSLTNGTSMFNQCYNLPTFHLNLSSLINGYYMFANCNSLTTFTSDLSSLTNGINMFNHCSKLKSFSSDLSSLTNGKEMFYYCNSLTSFPSDLSSLINGTQMFSNCTAFTTFTSDLSSLTTADGMFWTCIKLTTFTSDLSSLTKGNSMFSGCRNLALFSSDLSSLTNGYQMFFYCDNLASFSSDLSSLTRGFQMFYNCTKLTTFTSDLSSLSEGHQMFSKTKLTPQSVMYIADTIKDIAAEKQLYIDGTIPYVTLSNSVYSALSGFMENGNYVYTYNDPQPYTTTIAASSVGKLSLGINVSNNEDTIQQQLEDFAKEATFDSWADLKQAFVDKGWTVTFQYGGTDTLITYDLRSGNQIIPCPIFAKLVQVEDEDKDSAEYCTEDASTFYNIEWGHDVTDTSSYTQFNSLEDAMASWNVFPKENIITTEEEA